MDALKKFIAKKKADKVFKSAGAGQKLSDGPSTSGQAAKQPQQGGSKSSGHHHSQGQSSASYGSSTQSEEKRAAAAAALARLEKNKKPEADSEQLRKARQNKFIQDEARKQIEAERIMKQETEKAGTSAARHNLDSELREDDGPRSVDPADYAVRGVYFTCSFIGEESPLPKREIEERIREYFLSQQDDDIEMTSILLIHSCNKPQEKVQACVDTLCKYLNNIITKPDDDRVRRIRCANAVFQERVAPILGAEMFLKSAGFAKKMVDGEEFWVYSPSGIKLETLIQTLQETTPLRPDLDRNVQVLMPAEVTKRKELPDEFYTLSVEEIKREQKLKSEIAERERTLRTKEMRERDEIREQRLYRYGLMRVRFPDGLTLQGTFKAFEKVSNLYAFVQENLVIDTLKFDLIKSGGENLSEHLDATLSNMKLPPSSILNFKAQSAPAELATNEMSFLKPEILALVKSME